MIGVELGSEGSCRFTDFPSVVQITRALGNMIQLFNAKKIVH